MKKERYEFLAREIFFSALEVHKELGPGLLESVYVYALLKEFELRNIKAKREVKVPLIYKGHDTGKCYYIDILIEEEIIIETKSVETSVPIYEAQLLSHMKLTAKRMGFLINFNVPRIKDGFRRMVNNYFD